MINLKSISNCSKNLKIFLPILIYIVLWVTLSIIFKNIIERVIILWLMYWFFFLLILIDIYRKIKVEDLKNFLIRLIIVLFSYIWYWFLAIKLFNIHDVSLPIWTLWFFWFPISLMIFTKLDILINKYSKKRFNRFFYFFINNFINMFLFHINAPIIMLLLYFVWNMVK